MTSADVPNGIRHRAENGEAVSRPLQKGSAKNLARSVRNDRPGKGAGTPKRNQPCPMKLYRTRGVSPRGVGTGRFGQRTRIAYDALVETSPKLIKVKAEYDGRATCSVSKHYMWRVLSFMFLLGRLAMPLLRRG